MRIALLDDIRITLTFLAVGILLWTVVVLTIAVHFLGFPDSSKLSECC